jgi:hypothetical protein
VQGTSKEVSEHTGTRGWPGARLAMKTSNGTLDVHVGPTSYMAEKKFQFSKGDQIEVIGSKAKYEGAEALLARGIKKGDKSLTLRNAQAIPQWPGGGVAKPWNGFSVHTGRAGAGPPRSLFGCLFLTFRNTARNSCLTEI